MSDVLTRLRHACATVAQRASCVRVNADAIPDYAASLPLAETPAANTDEPKGEREHRAAFWLTLDAINFGSGWFPTLRKRPGKSGYHTIAAALEEHGPWPADELVDMTAQEIAQTLGQDSDHELMQLFARSLADLGRHIAHEYSGSFESVAVGNSALALVETLATWNCFKDVSTYDGITIPFLKRAQIAAADLARANVAGFEDLERLTMFADNLVPHVLRLDEILSFDPNLVGRIDRHELIEHGSREEVEIRACAIHAVELIVAQSPGNRACEIDQLLWVRGQEPHYKALPRHRSRTTAY
jgi:putative queuosine salvage protein